RNLPTPTGWSALWLKLANYELRMAKKPADAIRNAERAVAAFPADAPPEERGKLLYTPAGYYLAGGAHDAARRGHGPAVPPLPGPAVRALARQNLRGLPGHRDAIRAYNLLHLAGSQPESRGDSVTLLGIAQLQLGRHAEGVALLNRPSAGSVGGFRELYLALG